MSCIFSRAHGAYFRFQLGESDLFIHNHRGNLSCYVNRCPHREPVLLIHCPAQVHCNAHTMAGPSSLQVLRFLGLKLSKAL